jgi:hypothetical protein
MNLMPDKFASSQVSPVYLLTISLIWRADAIPRQLGHPATWNASGASVDV